MTSTTSGTRSVEALAGLAAGPLLAAVWLAHGLVRDGYDFGKHPMSLLALGDYGWAQIANFVAAGGLMLACAAGYRRSITAGVGNSWLPRLVALMGVGLVAAGVFTADPGAGFPAGAPTGAPAMSWHGVLHGVSFLLVQVSWVAFCLVARRRFARAGETRWAQLSVAVIPIAFGIIAMPHPPSFPVRLVIASVLQLGFVGAVAVHYR